MCHKVSPPSSVVRQPLCHKVNLPRCEARLRHLIMTWDIFGTGQTNTLTLCYLLAKTCKPAHSSATLESLKSTRSTKLLEKLLTWAAHTFHWRLWQGLCEVWIQMWKLLKQYIQFNSFCQQVDDWMLLEITEKIIRRNYFWRKKKNPGLSSNRPWSNCVL